MLTTVARYTHRPVEFAASVAFDRRFRIHGIDRTGLVFDTRFAPAVLAASPGVIVYLLLDGTIRWLDGREVEGPFLFVMPERDFEGEHGRRGVTFRSHGDPFRSVELRVAADQCTLDDEGARPGAELLSAARTYLHASFTRKGQGAAVELAAVYLRLLHAAGATRTDLAATITRDEGVRGLVWEALRPVIESFGGGVRQDDVVSRLGGSARVVQRQLTELALSLGVGWMGGWRDVAVRYRVRFAALLLSNPALSVTAVAEAVGYGSVEAMAHAFRGADLPAPSVVRRGVLEGFPPAYSE